MRLPFNGMCNVAHPLLITGQQVMRLPFREGYWHSLPVVHRTRCDQTAIERKCLVKIHLLLVIGHVSMRLPFSKMKNATHSTLEIGHNAMMPPFWKCPM